MSFIHSTNRVIHRKSAVINSRLGLESNLPTAFSPDLSTENHDLSTG